MPNLEQQIIDFVQKTPNATFVDLDNAGIAGFTGDKPFLITFPDTADEKLLWYLSPEAAIAVKNVIYSQQLAVFGLHKGALAYYEKAGKTLPDVNWFPLVFNVK